MPRLGRNAGVAACLLVSVLGASGASAQVEVRFVAPERYTDAENRFGSGISLRVTIGEVRRIMEDLAVRTLKPGERLSIDVLDIDLAGYEQPGANFPSGIRVVRDITPPRFRLRYVLSEGGRRVLGAEEVVTDANFMLTASRLSSGPFDYERDLLKGWFRRRIVERKPPLG